MNLHYRATLQNTQCTKFQAKMPEFQITDQSVIFKLINFFIIKIFFQNSVFIADPWESPAATKSCPSHVRETNCLVFRGHKGYKNPFSGRNHENNYHNVTGSNIIFLSFPWTVFITMLSAYILRYKNRPKHTSDVRYNLIKIIGYTNLLDQ